MTDTELPTAEEKLTPAREVANRDVSRHSHDRRVHADQDLRQAAGRTLGTARAGVIEEAYAEAQRRRVRLDRPSAVPG
jgi:hypothetical protein